MVTRPYDVIFRAPPDPVARRTVVGVISKSRADVRGWIWQGVRLRLDVVGARSSFEELIRELHAIVPVARVLGSGGVSGTYRRMEGIMIAIEGDEDDDRKSGVG